MKRGFLLSGTCLCFALLAACDGAPLVCPSILELDVQPRDPVVQVGESVQLEVHAWDGCRNPIDVDLDWTSSDSTVVVVSETGRSIGVSPGSAIVEWTDTGPAKIGSFGVRVEVQR